MGRASPSRRPVSVYQNTSQILRQVLCNIGDAGEDSTRESTIWRVQMYGMRRLPRYRTAPQTGGGVIQSMNIHEKYGYTKQGFI